MITLSLIRKAGRKMIKLFSDTVSRWMRTLVSASNTVTTALSCFWLQKTVSSLNKTWRANWAQVGWSKPVKEEDIRGIWDFRLSRWALFLMNCDFRGEVRMTDCSSLMTIVTSICTSVWRRWIVTLRLSNSWGSDEWSGEFKGARAAVVETQHIIQNKQEEEEEKDAAAEVMSSKAEEAGKEESAPNSKKSCQLWEQQQKTSRLSEFNPCKASAVRA